MHKLLRRWYVAKKVSFEVYDNGVAILKLNNKELARKVLGHKVAKSEVERAFMPEIENLRAKQIVPTPYGTTAYYKASIGKIVLRKPYATRRKRKHPK